MSFSLDTFDVNNSYELHLCNTGIGDYISNTWTATKTILGCARSFSKDPKGYLDSAQNYIAQGKSTFEKINFTGQNTSNFIDNIVNSLKNGQGNQLMSNMFNIDLQAIQGALSMLGMSSIYVVSALSSAGMTFTVLLSLLGAIVSSLPELFFSIISKIFNVANYFHITYDNLPHIYSCISILRPTSILEIIHLNLNVITDFLSFNSWFSENDDEELTLIN